MKRCAGGTMVLGLLLAGLGALAHGGDEQARKDEQALQKERKLLEGTWRIVSLEVNGVPAAADDTKKLTVVNGSGDGWSLISDGAEIAKGTNVLDPSKSPKTVDITITEGGGNGNVHLGIYELAEKSRRLCFAAAGKDRPTEFSSTSGNEQILVMFERAP